MQRVAGAEAGTLSHAHDKARCSSLSTYMVNTACEQENEAVRQTVAEQAYDQHDVLRMNHER